MTSSLTFCSIVCWFQWFSCFWGEAFFCGVGILLKPRDYSDDLISCPIWSNFFPRWAWVPERKYCKLPSDFETWKGPAWWEAPASSYLHWKGSAAWHWRLKINLWRGKLLNYCLRISLGSDRGKQRKAKGSWFPNVLFEHGKLLDSEA